jgi:cytoskeletal protein CcmA (bactofilin family)
VQAPHIVVNGAITGDVTASERLELASNARVEGNVYYKLLEMSAGAQINGKMVHRAEPPKQLPKPEEKASSS